MTFIDTGRVRLKLVAQAQTTYMEFDLATADGVRFRKTDTFGCIAE
jgi:hypothetical protein